MKLLAISITLPPTLSISVNLLSRPHLSSLTLSPYHHYPPTIYTHPFTSPLPLLLLFTPLLPHSGIDGLFFAGTSGRVLMKSEDRVVLFDQQARKVIAELQVLVD